MQFINIILGLAAIAAATPVPEPILEFDEGSANITERAAQGVCGAGYSIETYGSDNCGNFGQGISNSGTSCRVCVQMGNAKSWKILNPDRCRTMNVAYWHGANCNNGGVARYVTYNTGAQACNVIPTDIGDHFSAQFTCV